MKTMKLSKQASFLSIFEVFEWTWILLINCLFNIALIEKCLEFTQVSVKGTVDNGLLSLALLVCDMDKIDW